MTATPEQPTGAEVAQDAPETAPPGTLGRYWRMGFFALPQGDERYHLLAAAVNAAIYLRLPTGFTPWEDLKQSVTVANGHLAGIADAYSGLGVCPAELGPPLGLGDIMRCLQKRRPVEIPVMVPTFPGHHSILIVGREEDIFYACGWEQGVRVSEVPVWDIDKQIEWRKKWPWLTWYGRVWGKL